MDKAITTAILIVISMIMAVSLFNVAFPAIVQGGEAITGMAYRSEERMGSQIRIIHVAAELDSAGWWQDTNGNGSFDVFVWVKNVGNTRLIGLDQLDVFFGPEGNFGRIPHESANGGAAPSWSWQLENAAEWTPTGTLRLNIRYNLALAPGRYYVKVTTSNGTTDSYFTGL